MQGVSNPNAITVTKASLRDNKKWAWSHSFDDNVNLKPSVDVMTAKNWTGMFYLIGKEVNATRDESWIVDRPYLAQKLNEGWSIGNHTWNHQCSPSGNAEETSEISQAYNGLLAIVNASNKLTYKPIAFAAPCFASSYDDTIQTLRTSGQYGVKFNESQGANMMIVNPGASDYTSGAFSAEAADSTTIKFGRDAEIDWAPNNVKERMTWIANNANGTRTFWYNTFLHGNREANLSNVVNYAYTNYGPAGTNELWVAPADEVYSYLIVRDNATVGALNIQ